MDIILPFVDCSDKVWMKNYLSFSDSEENSKYLPQIRFGYSQFYNYNTVKYVIRGIDKYMPYVDNIFFVVSNIEQIPDYIDQSKVKIVLHKDFIPENYLPTFQANTIEMFMYNIPGLGEEFVYFNDDTIPVSYIPYEKLFKDGLPCIDFVEIYMEPETISYRLSNISFYEGLNTASILKGEQINYNGQALCPVHGLNTFLKSECLRAVSIKRHQSLLDFYISPFRIARNINQYYWLDILYFLNKYVPSTLKLKYITTQDIDTLDVENLSNYNYLCINDFGSATKTVLELKDVIKNKLEQLFPNECKYEKHI